jgi:nucleoside-diphosphate-sugar epimerase
MRILVIGGSGYVGSMLLPALRARHALRILDPRPPAGEGYEYLPGDATDPERLPSAMAGVDAVLHAAMAGAPWRQPRHAADAFDAHVKSVHLTLRAAHDAGVPHAVHLSSMSVFRRMTTRRLDESVPPDATDVYGLTKRLGEEVCRAAAARWRMTVNVLRLAWPTPDEDWPAWAGVRPARQVRTPHGTPIRATASSDLAPAVLAAFEVRDGYQVYTICGDDSAVRWPIDKARQRLGWTPRFGREGAADPTRTAAPVSRPDRT